MNVSSYIHRIRLTPVHSGNVNFHHAASTIADEVERLAYLVAKLEAAARKACLGPLGERHATCNAEAMEALDALVPEQPKDTP